MPQTEAQKAQAYERVAPNTGLPVEQKAERMDRRRVKAARADGHPMRIQTPSDFDGFSDSPKTCEWVEIGPGRYRRVPLNERG
jgi:hypothetical protein